MPYLSAPTNMGLKRDPSLAYNMSLVMPGLGQLYNKEKRKAGIFLIAGGINYAILILLIFAPAILENVKSFGHAYNIKLNSALVGALLQMQFGSGASLALLALFMLFAIFSAADARDRALYIERKAIYLDQAMALPEAAGGSYIFHMSLLVACAILAFFFLIPAPPREQVTEFEFKQVEESREKVVSKVRANSNSQGARHNDKMPTTVAKSSSSSSSSSSSRSSSARSSVSPPVVPSAPRASEPRPVSEPPLKPAFKPVLKPTSLTDSAVPLPAVKPNVVSRLPLPPVPVTAPASQPQQMPLPTQPLLALAPAPFKFQPRPVTVSGGQANPQPRMPVAAPTAGVGQSAAPHPVAVSPSSGQSSPDSGSGPTPVSVARTSAGNSGGPAPVAARSPGGQGLALAPNVKAGRDNGIGMKATKGAGGDDDMHNPSKGIGAGAGPAVREPDFGPYMADLQRRIKRAWFPPHVGRSKRIKVVFKVASDGRLVHLRMATSSGLEIADQAALKAVENAAPFRPLPPDAPAEVDIEFTFDYNVFNGGGSGTFKNF